MKIKSYHELRRLQTYDERFKYLSLTGLVGDPTFGSERYLNQQFYRSARWKSIRDHVIVRDNGCDLGVEGFEIYDKIIIHHMNPITVDEVVEDDPSILDPEFLICVTMSTHNAIHYGTKSNTPRGYVARTKGDTQSWPKRRP